MILNQLLGIFGALLMAVGVFAPLVSVPLWGGINLYSLSAGLALTLLAIAAAHLVACIRRLWWALWLTKSALVISLIYGLYASWDRLFGKSSLFGSLLKSVTKVHWGVAVLLGGVLIALTASLPRPARIVKSAAISSAPVSEPADLPN